MEAFDKVLSGKSQGEIVCGDCLEVMRQMPDGCVDLAFADPPFNIQKRFGEYEDNRPDYLAWLDIWLQLLWQKVRQGGSCYLKNVRRNLGPVDMAIRKLSGGHIQNIIAWQKHGGKNARRRYTERWEAIWFVTKGDNYTFNLDDIRIPCRTFDRRNNPLGKNPTDIWDITRVVFGSAEHLGHPAQTPVKLLERIIKASSNEGDLVFDPFMGSGTTAIAADRLGRNFFGCDINPDYVEMALRRLKKDRLERAQLEMAI